MISLLVNVSQETLTADMSLQCHLTLLPITVTSSTFISLLSTANYYVLFVHSIIAISYLYHAVGTPYSLRADQPICQSIIYAVLEHPNSSFFAKCHGNTTGREFCCMGLFLEERKVHLNPGSSFSGVVQRLSAGVSNCC